MMPLTRRLAPAAILALSAVSAHAQDGDVAAGHAFAREGCNACHMVEAKQKKPRRIVIGPVGIGTSAELIASARLPMGSDLEEVFLALA
jgi:cytochrome c2